MAAAPFGAEQLAVRDSKDVSRPPPGFSAAAWTSFVSGPNDGPVG
ncbi:DUF397 domain-containing protein [Streptomyces sp. NPDC048496]